MAFSSPMKRLILLTIMILMLVLHLSAAEFSSSLDNSQTETAGIDVDLVRLIERPTIRHQGEIQISAKRILHSLQSSPSCNRKATASLIDSCKSLERPVKVTETLQDVEITLDKVKSAYAARLAVCELMGAGAPGPTECSSFATSTQSKSKSKSFSFMGIRRNRSDESEDVVREEDLERCLRSLESRPQWWTSYSNARQNAVVMCQAARVELDRSDLLNLYISLTDATTDVTARLHDASQMVETHLVAQQSFGQAVAIMQSQTNQDFETMTFQMRTTFSSFFGEINGMFQGTAVKIHDASVIAHKDLDDINQARQTIVASPQNIGKTSSNVHSFSAYMFEFFNQIASSSSRFSSSQQKDLEITSNMAKSTAKLLEDINDVELQKLFASSALILEQLRRADHMAGQHHTQVQHLDNNLNDFGKSISQMKQHAHEALSAQAAHGENHARHLDNLHTKLQQWHDTIDRSSASAQDLHSTIEKATTSAQGLRSYSNVFALVPWVILIMAVKTVNKQAASYITMCIAAIYAWSLTVESIVGPLPASILEITSLKALFSMNSTQWKTTIVCLFTIVSLSLVTLAGISTLKKNMKIRKMRREGVDTSSTNDDDGLPAYQAKTTGFSA